ncbi:Lactose transport system permease protein LacF [Aquimixticola soesokkakensis]|uniref:Lactose transport system permease protein LacF n=1 Tax=Aquimixticola soesokkakensis TaxID=1519096 RepID=A0A1Y5RKK4_9RHOB|nr:sugar ABC transporter permease [Aquimixticola soesokkakensis]SLN19656.1 Lactose transport system permease protein LacF [Aquimixticola soesokkakensis]
MTALPDPDRGAVRAKAAPARRPSRLLHNPMSKVAAMPMIATALVIFVGCSLWTVVHSFTDSKLLPRLNFVGFEQYERLWSSSRWITSVENIAIYGVTALVLSLVLGFLFAALLDQRIRAEGIFRTIILYPYALSFIVTGLVWQWVLNPDFGIQNVVRDLGFASFSFDPLNNPDTVMIALLMAGLWQGTGLVTVIMLAGLRGVDEDIWKATRVDGIPAWKTYLFVVVPILRPVFVTATVLIATGIVKLYDLVVALTNGGPGSATQMPALYVYDAMFAKQNLAQGFAASTIMLLAVLVLLIPWSIHEFGGKKRG